LKIARLKATIFSNRGVGSRYKTGFSDLADLVGLYRGPQQHAKYITFFPGTIPLTVNRKNHKGSPKNL
jgi:hypothetical protein